MKKVRNMKLSKQIEIILREAGRKAVPIEDVRDAIMEAIKVRDEEILTGSPNINYESQHIVEEKDADAFMHGLKTGKRERNRIIKQKMEETL